MENKSNEEKDKDKEKGKRPEKPVKKPEKTTEQPKTEKEKSNGANGGAAGAEANSNGENGEFQPIELPPFEIVTGWVRFKTYSRVRVSMSNLHTCSLTPPLTDYCVVKGVFHGSL